MDIFGVLILLLDIYSYMILAIVFLSWIQPDPFNPIVRFLNQATQPVLRPFRRMLMPLTMQIRIDFSPILVFLAIRIVQNVLRRIQSGGFTAAGIGWSLVDSVFIFVSSVAMFFVIVLVIRTIIDWTHASRHNPIVNFIDTITDPIVYRFRAFRGGNRRFSFAPAAAVLVFVTVYLALETLRNFLVR